MTLKVKSIKSAIIEPKYTLSNEVIDELVSYQRVPEDTQKALVAAGYLLDWAGQRISDGRPVDGTLLMGLGEVVRSCAREVGRLYSDEDVMRLGGMPFSLERGEGKQNSGGRNKTKAVARLVVPTLQPRPKEAATHQGPQLTFRRDQ